MSASACVCGASPHEPYCASPEAFADRTAGVTLAICIAGHATVRDLARETACQVLVGRHSGDLAVLNGRRCGARIAGQPPRRSITLPLDRECLCCGENRASRDAGCPGCNLLLLQVTDLNSGVLHRHFGTVRDPDRFGV